MSAVEDADGVSVIRVPHPCGSFDQRNVIACTSPIEKMAAAGRSSGVIILMCAGSGRNRYTQNANAWLTMRGIAWWAAAAPTTAFLGA